MSRTAAPRSPSKTLAACLCLLLVGCNASEDDDGAAFREMCTRMCALVACTGLVTDEQGAACADRCIEKRDDAERVGARCTDAYERSVECFASLECPEYLAWEGGDASVCEDPLLAFEDRCPELTFDFRE